MSERKTCKVCRRGLPPDRLDLGLKTCGAECSRRLKGWRSPRSRAIAATLPRVQAALWNDYALRARLGDLSREEASRRLAELARTKGLIVCLDPTYPGGVLFIGAPRLTDTRRPPAS
jgi:hypothetical protein